MSGLVTRLPVALMFISGYAILATLMNLTVHVIDHGIRLVWHLP